MIRSEFEPTNDETLSEGFLLEQNYPNPFNPSTEISYNVPEDGLVRLTVYNSLGQLVRILVDSQHTAGSHNVTFDAGDLPSGTYMYRLEVGSFSDTKFFMLVR